MTLICKSFSALTLFKELGITNLQSTNTCKHHMNINHDTPFNKHFDDLLRYLEFLFQKITNVYHQFTGHLTYIKIEPKLSLLLQFQYVL